LKPVRLHSAEDHNGYAVLNWMRNPKGEFRLYLDAYHDAGKTLLDALTRPQADSTLTAFLSCLYRQALELNLKSIIIRGNGVLRLHDEPEVAGAGLTADQKRIFTKSGDLLSGTLATTPS